MFCSFSLLV